MSEKKSVLVICHSAAGQMYLGILLSRIWYTASLVKNAAEGVHMARDKAFSLIILNGDPSDEELYNSVSLIRSDGSLKHTPLVVFIAQERAEVKDNLVALGCSAVVTKPLDISIVYGVLSRLSGQVRAAPRIAVRFRVEMEADDTRKTLTCTNLSEGGMYLRTHDPLPEGTKIRLSFRLPKDTEVNTLDGEVIRTMQLGHEVEFEPGMGVRFIDPPDQFRQRIRNFVQWELMGDLEWEASL